MDERLDELRQRKRPRLEDESAARDGREARGEGASAGMGKQSEEEEEKITNPRRQKRGTARAG